MDCLGSPTRKRVCEWPSQERGEELDEVVLGGGGVLHLVDEEVLERAPRAAARSSGPESAVRAVRARRASSVKSHWARFGEDELELDEGAAEDAEEGLGDGPLVGGVLRGRERVDAAEGLDECG